MTWNLTVSGDLIADAEKTAEDLERELFDAVGPVLKRFGAYASHFMGQHITGAPHQVTSDAAAPAGATGGAVATQVDVTTTAPDPAQAGTPFTTIPDGGEDQAAPGGIESDPDPGGTDAPSTAAEPDTTTHLPAPSTPVDPPHADVPLPDAPDTGAAATT